MKPGLLILLPLLLAAGAANAQSRGQLLPPDWVEEQRQSATEPLRYTSPDGDAWLTLNATPAKERRGLQAARPDEQVTYRRVTPRFVAISGYRGNRIFYRKSNLACRGTRWHHVELEYPAEDKRKMDRLVTRLAHGMNRYDSKCTGGDRAATSGGLVRTR